MEFKTEYVLEVENIRSNEVDLLLQFVANNYERNRGCVRKFTPAEIIAYAITHITALYANAIKKHYGGWTTAAYLRGKRIKLTQEISSKYEDDQLSHFILLCVECNGGRKSFCDASNDIKEMTEDFLTMRPKPIVL